MAINVRDHRSAPVVRDHRSEAPGRPVVRDHRTETPSRPVVRDHRTEGTGRTVIRDHRADTIAPPQTRPPVVVAPLPRPILPAPPTPIISAPFPSTVMDPGFAPAIGNIIGGGNVNETLQNISRTVGTSEAAVVANMGPGARDMYNQLLKDDPKQARAFLVQEMMAGIKLLGEMLSNVSKTRSEISMTFARNSRG